MFSSNGRKQFDRKSKKILRYINKTGKLPEMDDCSKRCLYHCVEEARYIDGLAVQKMITGRITVEIASDQLTLTKAGLDFLWKPIPWEAWINVLLALVTLISVIVAIIQTIHCNAGIPS